MELRCAVLFVFFEFMAVYVATAASINCSLTWKPDFHTGCHYYHQHLHEQQAGLPTSDGFVLKGRMLKKSHRISSSMDAHDKRDLQEGRMLKKSHRISSSMDTHDKRDLRALLSFRNAITSDPTGSLSDWTMENSEKICSWKGIWCRRSTRRVVAIILPRLGLAGLSVWTWMVMVYSRMECMAQEPVLFEDILCQMVDMIAPEKEWLFTLRDLKRCKLSGSVFNILFNLNKFMAFETRDPFLIRQEREDPTLTEWDRFAHKDYIRLSMEEDGENASNGSAEVWDESLEAPF